MNVPGNNLPHFLYIFYLTLLLNSALNIDAFVNTFLQLLVTNKGAFSLVTNDKKIDYKLNQFLFTHCNKKICSII